MKGWRFRYFCEVESPAELPATMPALKSQQHRWTKGAAETAMKHLSNVWKSSLKLTTKFHATMHLFNSSIFLAIMISSLLSVPVLFIKHMYIQETEIVFGVATWFFMSLISLMFYYATAFFRIEGFSGKKTIKFLLMVPVFFSLTLGMTLHNTMAVIEGLIGKKTPFVRTPKFDIQKESANRKWQENIYRIKKVNPLTWVEGLMAVYFLSAMAIGIYLKEYSLIFMHVSIAIGYLSIFYFSLKHSSTR